MSRILSALAVFFALLGTAYCTCRGLAYLLDHTVGPRHTLTWCANPGALTVGYLLVVVHSLLWAAAAGFYVRWVSK